MSGPRRSDHNRSESRSEMIFNCHTATDLLQLEMTPVGKAREGTGEEGESDSERECIKK